MPNWCENNLRIYSHCDNKASEEQFQALMKEIGMTEDEEINFSFNHFSPQPPELDVVEGGCNDKALALVQAVDGKDNSGLEKYLPYKVEDSEIDNVEDLIIHLSQEKVSSFQNDKFKDMSMLDYGRILFNNLKVHGYISWYRWRIDNWGTKWDVGEVYVNDHCESGYLELQFDTAWSPPTGVLKAMGLKYPELTFTLKYEETGCSFMGVAKAKGDDFSDQCIDY